MTLRKCSKSNAIPPAVFRVLLDTDRLLVMHRTVLKRDAFLGPCTALGEKFSYRLLYAGVTDHSVLQETEIA